MTNNTLVNITALETAGTTVTTEHFGINHVFEYERIGNLPWERFDEVVRAINVEYIRYPGGTAAETIFDIENPNATTFITPEGATLNLTPLHEFLSFCKREGAAAIITIPATTMLDDTGQYGARDFDASRASALRLFVLQTLEYGGPETIATFELGNEYESYMTSVEYGRVASAMALIVQNAVNEYRVTRGLGPDWQEPKIAVQVWTQSVHGGVTADELQERNFAVMAEFSSEELATIDALTTHFYYLDGRAAGTLLENSFENIGNSITQSLSILQDWATTGRTDLSAMISEWNIQHNSAFGTGLQQIPVMLSMFSSFLLSGADQLTFWSSQYHATSLAQPNGDLSAAGLLFEYMRENLIGTSVVELTDDSQLVDLYGFKNENELIIFVSSISNDQQISEVEFEFEFEYTFSKYYLTSITVFSADPSSADSLYRGVGGYLIYSEPDIAFLSSVTFAGPSAGSEPVLLWLRPWETAIFNFQMFFAPFDGEYSVWWGTSENDALFGDGQNNLFIGSSTGDDIYFGADGMDFISYENSLVEAVVDLQYTVNGLGQATFNQIDGLVGSSFSDVLRGNLAPNEIFGLGGDDTLNGRAGDDLLDGGDGDDCLLGGAGSDTLIGGAGSDTVGYWTAWQGVVVNLVDSTLNEGDAAGDSFVSVENIIGSNYADHLTGDDGRNIISGGDGDDTIRGFAGNDFLNGDSGDDLIICDIRDNIAMGGDGNDTLVGGAGNDSLFGGEGDDVLYASSGESVLLGGSGGDYFIVSDHSAVVIISDFELSIDVIDLRLLSFLSLSDQIVVTSTASGAMIQIENVIIVVESIDGTALLPTSIFDRNNLGNGVLLLPPEFEGDLVNEFFGTLGCDTLIGGEQANHILGFEGSDRLIGGASADTLDGGSGDDLAIGGLGNDSLIGGLGADLVDGGAGNDVLSGGVGNDYLMGGDGSDLLLGGDGSDRLLGGAGNDVLAGEAGNDELDGGTGDDLLMGGEGSDVLIGGGGSDTLSGGAGFDLLTGGFGVDYFVFNANESDALGFAPDLITDFTLGEDLIDLRGLGLTSFIGSSDFSGSAGQVRYEITGSASVVSVDIDGDTLADLVIHIVGEPMLSVSDLLL